MEHKTNWNNGDVVDAPALNRIEGNLCDLDSKKVDAEAGRQLSSNDYSNAEKSKLAGIEDGATNYVHPDAHPATMISEDDSHSFVTVEEKAAWNDKAGSNEVAKLEQMISGFVGKTTTFNVDGSVIETDSSGNTKVTTFPEDSLALEVMTKVDGTVIKKRTYWNEAGQIQEEIVI